MFADAYSPDKSMPLTETSWEPHNFLFRPLGRSMSSLSASL